MIIEFVCAATFLVGRPKSFITTFNPDLEKDQETFRLLVDKGNYVVYRIFSKKEETENRKEISESITEGLALLKEAIDVIKNNDLSKIR